MIAAHHIKQHLLNTPDRIFLHLKEGLKVEMICSRDQRKEQKILLKDILVINNIKYLTEKSSIP